MKSRLLQIYQAKGGAWRWRLRARNGRIIADGAEGYTQRSRCVDMALRATNPAERTTVRYMLIAPRRRDQRDEWWI